MSRTTKKIATNHRSDKVKSSNVPKKQGGKIYMTQQTLLIIYSIL